MENLETLIIESNENTKKKAINDNEKEKMPIHRFIGSKLNLMKNNFNRNEPDPLQIHLNIANSMFFKLDEINTLAVLSHSFTSYLLNIQAKKNGDLLKNITIKIYDSVNLWLSRLFR